MEYYSLPERISGIVFDIDRTLYTNEEYVEHQEQVLYARFAKEKGIEVDEARRQVDAYREQFARDHGGRKQSLGNSFAALGVPMEQSVLWREQEMQPERYLSTDKKLHEALERLTCAEPRVPLVALTNNPVLIGRRALRALGVESLFVDVVGLDSAMQSKPDLGGFTAAFASLECPKSEIVSIGDRYEIDIAPALELGVGGVLVSGVSEVYELPPILTPRFVQPVASKRRAGDADE
jgi:phosphoglycolate phosphatase/putative hydrolase of the HAD superfamily